MPDRSSRPLDSPEVVGDPIGPIRRPSPAGAEDRPADPDTPEQGNSQEASQPALLPSSGPQEEPSKTLPPAPPSLGASPPEPPQSSRVGPVAPGIELSEKPAPRRWRSLLLGRHASSCLVSCLFHAVVLVVLGLIVDAARPRPPGLSLVAYNSEPVSMEDLIDQLDWEIEVAHPHWLHAREILVPQEAVAPDIDALTDDLLQTDRPSGTGLGLEPSNSVRWADAADMPLGGGLEGRGRQARAGLVEQDGGTPESEAAVERGLRWLQAYQREDGSWSFDHNKGRRAGLCPNPGKVASTTGATAIALAPFLGAGYTHQGGEYQDTVRKGLYYLVSRALVTPDGVDLQEGTMYAQGLAGIVLCEAYAMTGDPGLKDIAQRTIDFIDYAQDKRGGGWRYTPGEAGDTTVTGWQLMALKSGQMAKLQVRPATFYLAAEFLDSVQSEEGARYGYTSTDPRYTTTAIGLLCRMYLGWPRSHAGLRQGVAYLSEWGPSGDNMYYNYYATQVLRHWGGAEWEKWNPKMRDYLIATQATRGHEAGSWYFSGGHGDTGGRLYNTAVAVMTLEVYYRYMPLYRPAAVNE